MSAPPVQRSRQTNHRKGLLLAGIGALFLTFDVPLVRLADSDTWTVIFVRGSCVFIAMFVFWLWRRLIKKDSLQFVTGPEGVAAGVLFACTNITFLTAIHHTNAANAVFLLAFAPFIAAILSRIFLAEPIKTYTWIAILVAVFGIFVIGSDGIGTGHLFGDLMALAAAASLACQLTVMRWSGKDMTMSPGFGSLLTALAAVWFAKPFELQPDQIALLSFNSLLLMPMALGLLAMGTRYISAPEVAMLMLLDSCIAPVWVWLLIGEVPTSMVIFGGVVVVSAIMVHSYIQARKP